MMRPRARSSWSMLPVVLLLGCGGSAARPDAAPLDPERGSDAAGSAEPGAGGQGGDRPGGSGGGGSGGGAAGGSGTLIDAATSGDAALSRADAAPSSSPDAAEQSSVDALVPVIDARSGAEAAVLIDAAAGDIAPARDVAPADRTPAPDAVAAGTCGGVRCPALFEAVAACRPEGSCRQEAGGPPYRRCYDNGVDVVATVALVSFMPRLSARFLKPDGSPCYLLDAPLATGPGTNTFVFKTPAGAEIARALVAADGSTSIVCGGAAAPLTDRACLPAFDPNECTTGTCP